MWHRLDIFTPKNDLLCTQQPEESGKTQTWRTSVALGGNWKVVWSLSLRLPSLPSFTVDTRD